MWFKNLQLYRLPPKWHMAPGTLEQRLAAQPLKPCTGLNLQTRGWVAPRDDGQLVYAQEKHYLIALGVEQKLLPGAVVNQAVKEQAEKLAKSQGFKPGRKQLRDLKDQVSAELLPRAFVRRRVTHAWLNPDSGWLIVDSANAARAELVVETLRSTFTGSFAATPLATNESTQSAMTAWLTAGEAPGAFELDQDCELKDASAGATVRYVRHGLEGKDIPAHIRGGKAATRLGLSWKQRIGFVLADPLQLKRVRFLEMEKAAEDAQTLDGDAQFEADFTLMTGELGKLLAELFKQLGGVTD
ncbi:MAG TPA: recombination-associated protein RdgC [Solimonas sp.]|nr:recombination-associated protein RdgC [Solimonas sp.]